MIRVIRGFRTSPIEVKVSPGSGARAPLASLSQSASDPLPGPVDYPPKKRKKKAAQHGDH